jgi:hypothetical protein
MRSLIFALALAAPVCAVAATPSYSNPMDTARHQAEQVVFLTFVNYTSQDRELVIGNQEYKLRYHTVAHVYAAVGSPVFVYSETNTKVNGQELMRVSANDRDKSILLK